MTGAPARLGVFSIPRKPDQDKALPGVNEEYAWAALMARGNAFPKTQLTEGFCATGRYTGVLYGQVVHWDSSESNSQTATGGPGVRIQRQTHDKETHHCEDHRKDQRNLDSHGGKKDNI